MLFVLVINLVSGVYGCEMDPYNANTVLYFDKEILNLTVSEGAYPDDVEVTKLTGWCSSPMRLLPDQYFDDTFKKYEHVKQIRVTMTPALQGCAYDVSMRVRGACLARRMARFELRPRAAPAPAPVTSRDCHVAVALRWRDELRAKFAAERWFVCDTQHALCEERNYVAMRDIVLNSEQIIINSDYRRKIQINLGGEDFAQNVSTFVCQAVSQYLPGNLTVAGRLVAGEAPPAAELVQFRAGDPYRAACAGPHAHWILHTDAPRSLANITFTKTLENEDDGMTLFCVDIDCEAFESNQTCFKNILKEIRFCLKAAQEYGMGVIVGAVSASLVLVGAVWCVVRARRRFASRALARRPRMPTPPPERPPRHQPYYSVPFERPIPGPRRD